MAAYPSVVIGLCLLLVAHVRLSGAALRLTDTDFLTLPTAGSYQLRVLSPALLELTFINTKDPDPAPLESWNFVDSAFEFHPPPVAAFVVKANSQPISVQLIHFKRRPLYAPLVVRDLRIQNWLYLELANPILNGQSVVVENPDATLWGTNFQFTATMDPLRFSPALHVNQEGYAPALPKKAMVGSYLGSGGEMNIAAALGFKLVDAQTGVEVYQGPLALRPDVGYTYTPTPYQKVLEADFTVFNTPGKYRLTVPGLGASLPFSIHDGVPLSFARAYALGLYHQRCGTSNALPFTRFTHRACHTTPADVPLPASAFAFTWYDIAYFSSDFSNNPRHTAPQLQSPASSLYPFVRQGKLDVSGGHHDAGDYSKYTINSAGLERFH